jgi:DNA-directed RNA polymerase specialized sigma24 family protein
VTDENAAKPVHSPEEMCAIIGALSQEDIDRLTLVAASLANMLGGVDGEDLLHDAFVASTIGKRRCPKDVNPVAFLIGAMRSNLSNLRRKSLHTESSTGQEDDLVAIADDTPERWMERMEILKGIAEELKEAFGDDERPLLVLEGRLDGMTRDEIRELVELDWPQFESLEKKIRRFMSKRLSERRAA